jgi:hypothetical protein
LNSLSFWGSSNFLCEFFTSEKMGYVPFFMWILKLFCFHILKFWNLLFITLEVSHAGK